MFACLITFSTLSKAQSIESMLEDLSKANDAESKLKILSLLSDSVINDNPKQAILYEQQALEIANNASKHKEAIYSLLSLMEINYTMSDLKTAMQYGFEAREIAVEHDFMLELAIILDHMGMIYFDIGDKHKCSQVFFESLKIYEELSEKYGISKVLSWIGLLYYDQHNYDKAWEYYSKSLEISKEIEFQEGIAANLNNLAKVLSSRMQYRESLKYLNESLNIHLKYNEPYTIASNYLNIGYAHYSLEEYPLALDYYSKALDLFTSMSNRVRIGSTHIKMGETYLKMGSINQSIQNTKKALEIGQNNGYLDITFQSSKLLHIISLDQKDTIMAYRYAVIEKQCKDSLELKTNEKNLASLELQYLFDKKDQEELVARQQKNAFIISAFIFLTLTIIIILLILNQLRLKAKKTRLEKKNLEQELDFKKKELILNVMSLMKQNEMFAEISRKILQYESQVEHPESLEILKTIGNKVRKSNDRENLKAFSMRFKEIHKEYYEALLAQFPTLTPNELRLCAFLKLNMTSKEISELTGQQLNAIEHARYKLRVKLGISNSEANLITFLTQF